MNPLEKFNSMFLSSGLQIANHPLPLPKYKFCCKNCDFYTNKSCNYVEHLKTNKHKVTMITNPVFVHELESANVATTVVGPNASNGPNILRKTYPCKSCNKPYYSKKGLWQHSKKCQNTSSSSLPLQEHTNDASEKAPIEVMASMMLELFKANQSQMLQIINAVLTTVKPNTQSVSLEQPTSMSSNPINHVLSNSNVSVSGNMTNINHSNNKTFNLNMFLNDTCKDAMNITEFVQKIQLDTDDMEDVGKHGFVKGISNIFISNLEKTDVTKRPIHCSDVKREILYIKEDDKWERENIDSKKLVDAVRVVEQKNVNLINQWAKEHPECEKSETQANNLYMKLSKNADGNDESIAKVIKNVVRNVVINKNDYDITSSEKTNDITN